MQKINRNYREAIQKKKIKQDILYLNRKTKKKREKYKEIIREREYS